MKDLPRASVRLTERELLVATREPPAAPNGLRHTATLELLAAWKAEDATSEPEKLREADKEIAEFKTAMNENRAATSACPPFR